ncbi:MAG: LD-carboxypeptidase [bacterium]|nr:LD-carboxypeptidase [bacterium]
MVPNKLKKGDEIRVIAPSGSLSRLDPINFNIAKERFEKIGLKVSISKNAYNVDEYSTSSVEDRINDLHEAFKDNNVKMIICAIGGYSVIQLLNEIDYELISKNPKIIIGYSDNTALLNAIYAKTGLVTYLGPNFTDFAVKKGFDYTLDYFIKVAFGNSNFEIIDSSDFSDDKWYIHQDDRVFIKNDGRIIVNTGEAEGLIVGGNLCTLQLLQGTEYMPSLENKILFIEDDDLVGDTFIFEFDRNLHSLMLQPGFDKVKGLIIGRNQLGTKLSNDEFKKVLQGKKELKNIPVIINMDFGHTRPLFTIPIGEKCIIDKDKVTIIQS